LELPFDRAFYLASKRIIITCLFIDLPDFNFQTPIPFKAIPKNEMPSIQYASGVCGFIMRSTDA
jgi:hypothetical protein